MVGVGRIAESPAIANDSKSFDPLFVAVATDSKSLDPDVVAVATDSKSLDPGATVVPGYSKSSDPGAVVVTEYSKSLDPRAVVVTGYSKSPDPRAATLSESSKSPTPPIVAVPGYSKSLDHATATLEEGSMSLAAGPAPPEGVDRPLVPPDDPRSMPRKPGPLAVSRSEVLLRVKELLEDAGTTGMTKQELLAAIGPERTSLSTIQRVLSELRDIYDAQLTCSGVDRRWRLEVPLAMPLEAPEPEDLLVARLAQPSIERLGIPWLRKRFGKYIEVIDERLRRRVAPADLPTHKAITSSISLAMRINATILSDLGMAARRRRVRILYASPWKPPATARKWHTIEPWALHMHDNSIFVRAWSNDLQQPRTYRLVHIEAVEPVDESTDPTPRRSIPADIWGEEHPAFGIDDDRPGVAVIRMCGAVARWVATTQWHPDETNDWIEPGELLERSFAYRSGRELARLLASVFDGIVSIEPPELREEVFGLWRRSPMAAHEQMINS